MRILTTYTSAQLSKYARRLGLEYDVAFVPDNAASGRYYVIASDGLPLSHWIPLGRSRTQAERILQGLVEDVAEGEP